MQESLLLIHVRWLTGYLVHRSELAGACGAIAIVAIFVQFFEIEAGGITLAQDGESALKQCQGSWPLSFNQKSFDLLQDIRARVASLSVKVSWKWVEGHQDDHAHQGSLDWWARMNIHVDNLAKSFICDCTEFRPTKNHKPQQLLYKNGLSRFMASSSLQLQETDCMLLCLAHVGILAQTR